MDANAARVPDGHEPITVVRSELRAFEQIVESPEAIPAIPIRFQHDAVLALLIERLTWSRALPASFALLYHPGNRFELRGGFEV